MMTYSTVALRQLRRTIGLNIHEFRLDRRMPLAKLSSLTGICSDRLDRYEIGKNDISLEHMLRIACAQQKQVVDLFKGFPAP